MELRFHVGNSALLTEEEKVTISEKLKNRITQDGFLVLVSQSERTQSGNRERVTEKFYELLRKALTPRKKRKPTHPSRASKEKRLEEKREQSDKKSARKPVR